MSAEPGVWLGASVAASTIVVRNPSVPSIVVVTAAVEGALDLTDAIAGIADLRQHRSNADGLVPAPAAATHGKTASG
ncbi:MAG: hypothetical protein ACLFU0_04485 [Alphaproteobacteria bacterium]